MNAWIEPTGRRVQPFDDPVGETPIANRPLSEWQAELIRAAGLQLVETCRPPCLVIPDTLFASEVVLRRFVEGAAGRNAVLVLATSQFGKSTTPVQPGVTAIDAGWRFEAVRWLAGDDAPPVDVIVDPEERVIPLPLSEAFGNPEVIPLARHPVMTIHHWVHIVWANHAAAVLEGRRVPPRRWLLRIVWAAIRARSRNKWRVLARMNRIGAGCDIHPSAVVEGSTLGRGVTVGPHARVLFSRLADGVTILTGAEVQASTIGTRATVGQRAELRFTVVYPEAVPGQVLMQACVLGRRVVTTPASYSLDVNLEREVRVMLDGRLHGTGTRHLGSAYGHDSRVAPGVFLAPGRAIPNGSVVIKDPSEIVTRVPERAADGPMINRGGTLTALDPSGAKAEESI
jgi:carbonic anhydrase/acetyltransferase-like protein (isoleucine patch superfamily)